MERAIRLAEMWSEGYACSLRGGEAEEYHAMCLAALREQEELADLIEAKKEGRLVVLPCNPGDMVYRIVWWGKRNVDIRERRVSSVEYNAAGEWVIHSTGSDVLGKTVFLTREEAEKALKGDA
jgi:hypothetical protein